MPMTTPDLRHRYFEAGVSAWERVRQHLLVDGSPVDLASLGSGLYPCPLCGRLLSEDDLERGELTLEHVPPRFLGGAPLILTCRPCNNQAGHTVDAAVHRRQRFIELNRALRQGRGRYSGRASLQVGEHTLNIQLEADNGRVQFIVPHFINSPATFKATAESFEVQNAPATVGSMRLRSRERFDFRTAKI